MRNQCSKLFQLGHPFDNMSNMDFFCSPDLTRPTMISTSPTPQTPIRCRSPYDQSGFPKTSLLSPSNIINHSNVSYPYYMPESPFRNHVYAEFIDIPVAAPPVFETRMDGDVGEDNGEEVEEIIRRLLGLFERLPSSLKDKVAMEIMKKETSKENGLKIGSTSTTTSTRSIGQVEDPSMGLERFKVKTFVVGDVIEDDQKI